jgi:hypothetical protein
VRRYAGDDVQHVLVIGGSEAPRRRGPIGRRRRVDAVPERPVDVTRATVIEAVPLRDAAAAEAWLARALADEAATLDRAVGVLTRAVAAQRLAAADPWLADPDPARALATRVGYGAGEVLAEGDWEVARELAPPRRARGRRALAPQERVAALLAGRDAPLACEELALRARADLDRGRGREAALQLDAALRAALAELEGWREHRDMARRLTELAGHREAVAAAAATALRGGLGDGETAAVTAALDRLEAALRARAAPASTTP